VRRRLTPQPEIRVGGRVVEADTRYAVAGGRILVLTTAVPELGAELHSVYVGARGVDTAVTELWLAPGNSPEAFTRSAREEQLSLEGERRRCLYDHAQRLQDQLHALAAAPVAIHLDGQAVDALQRALR
jgi:hypothetical protein